MKQIQGGVTAAKGFEAAGVEAEMCIRDRSQDLIHVITLGGQHDHRYIGKFADLLADLKAGQLRQHDVQ